MFVVLFLVVTRDSAYPQPAPHLVFLGSANVDGNFDRDIPKGDLHRGDA